MSIVKEKLKAEKTVVGTWMMIGHPAIAEIYAGENIDFICVDLEHTATGYPELENICRAVKGSGKDVLVRLSSSDPAQAKRVLDIGVNGIIVPDVRSKAEAEKAVAIAKFPPDGVRGASLARSTDYGRNFFASYQQHNDNVFVAIMLEHVEAVSEVEEIVSVPGIDATFIGPYDLSSSMGKAGQLDDPEVRANQQKFLQATQAAGIAPGLHIVPMDPPQVKERIDAGYRFIALSLDQEMLLQGVRQMVSKI